MTAVSCRNKSLQHTHMMTEKLNTTYVLGFVTLKNANFAMMVMCLDVSIC